MDSVQKMLKAACKDSGNVDFYNGYSGRAMYGKTCVGLVGTYHNIQRLINEVQRQMVQELFDTAINCSDDNAEKTTARALNDAVQEALEKLADQSYDSMGLDKIVYFSELEPLSDEDDLPTDISIDTVTTPTLRGGKGNPLQGQVRKVMIGGNVMIFTNKRVNGYDAMVKRRLEKEGKDPASFQLSPRTWGERIEGTPFVEHNGQLYLEVIFLRAGKVHYTHGARPIAKEAITGLEDKEEAHQGGLENKVVIRTFKADSIQAITINGERHVL